MKLVIPGIALVIVLLIAMLVTMPSPRKGPTREAVARAQIDSVFRARIRAHHELDIGIAHMATGATRRGPLAWVAAELDVRPRDGGEVRRIRHTALFAREDGSWQVELEDESRAAAESELRGATGHLADPDTSGGRIERRSKSLARRFRKLVAKPTGARIARTACAIGPLAGEFAAGDTAVRELLAGVERRLGPLRVIPASVTTHRLDDRGGWVAATVEARPPGGDGTRLFLRLSTAWREQGENSWHLALMHLWMVTGHSDPQAILTE